MRIKNISIKNFRSFENSGVIEFYDIGKPITIIGENNAGKSNIIKAILYGIGYKYIGEDGILESDFYNKKTDQKIEIQMTLDVNGATKNIQFITGNDYRDTPKITSGGNGFYKTEKDPIIDKIFFYDFQQVANLLKIKNDFSYTPLGKIVKKIKEDFKRDKTLQDSMNGEIDKFINDQITKNGDYQGFKTKIGEKLKKNLKNHSEDFDFKHTIQDVDKIINGLSFFVQENKDKPLISVENFGSGFRTLLVFSIFEAISESNDGGNVYIFEEPETFLHENYEEYFFELLRKLAENNQVILTTHSKKFVDIFDFGTIIRLNNNGDTGYKTICRQKQLTEPIQKRIQDKLLSDNGNLEYPKQYGTYMKGVEPNIGLIAFSQKIIIVEGPHDVLGYKISLGKKLLEDGYITNSLGYLGTNIVCVHNKDLIGPLMYICSELGTKTFIIFDSDLPVGQNIDLTDDGISGNDYTTKAPYAFLDIKWKQHYTKTIKLISIAKKLHIGYQINCPKIEGVLGFEIDDAEKLTYKNKSSLSIFEKLEDKTYTEIKAAYPDFISSELENFIFE